MFTTPLLPSVIALIPLLNKALDCRIVRVNVFSGFLYRNEDIFFILRIKQHERGCDATMNFERELIQAERGV
jgi:ferredoxin-fold anticodon binding domain-containing protein